MDHIQEPAANSRAWLFLLQWRPYDVNRQERIFAKLLWVSGAVVTGTILAHVKMSMLGKPIMHRLCDFVGETCTSNYSDSGILSLSAVTGYIFYPLSLVIMLFLPRRSMPLVVLVICLVGSVLDAFGFLVVAIFTMGSVLIALSDYLGLAFIFLITHAVLSTLAVGWLHSTRRLRG